MNLQALRERTRPEHEATEAQLPLMNPSLTLAAYVAALQALYPVLRGWDLWADQRCPERMRPLLAGRRRSLLLERDLRSLGSEPAGSGIVGFDSLLDGLAPENLAGSEACFFGALYVVEGSTLGGQFIARHVEAVLGLMPGQGDAYFEGYGAETGSRWREVREALLLQPDTLLEDTILAARRTFGLFAEAVAPLNATLLHTV